jgi:hypothetical protein
MPSTLPSRLLLPLLLVGACSSSPTTTHDGSFGQGNDPGDGDRNDDEGDGDQGDGDDTGDGDGRQGDGDDQGFCQVKKVEPKRLAPDMMILLDRSMSMIGINYDFSQVLRDRWTPATGAVNKIVTEFDGSIRFGLTVFPADGEMCAPSTVNVPIGGTPAQIKAALDAQFPRTFSTPTALALEAAAAYFDKAKTGGVDRYVLLVTDGQPTCDPGPAQFITANAEAIAHTNEALDALLEMGIKTFVIGFDAASGGLVENLDGFAMHGGTGKSVDATDEKTLVDQFRKLAGKVVSCSFELDSKPADATYVEVKLDGQLVRLDETDGWTISDKTVTLQNGSCEKLQDGAAHDLAIRVLCEPLL